MIEKIKEEIKLAMKARDRERLEALKMLSAELQNAKIDLGDKFSNKDAEAVVKREVKKRRDSIDAYTKAGRQELVEKEKKELEVLMDFMPVQLSEDQIGMLADEAIAEMQATSDDMGKVIGAVMSKAKGAADGTIVSQVVKKKLSS